MFKVRVLCCNASSKWAVSGRDSQLQRNDHGSDRSWMARVLCCNTSSMGSLGQTADHGSDCSWMARATSSWVGPAKPRAAPSSEATVRPLTCEGSAACWLKDGDPVQTLPRSHLEPAVAVRCGF